jgi:hypothetical protein
MAEEKHPKKPSAEELSKLKRDLEGYRELLLPLNKVLEWEKNYYPAVLVGIVTFIFALIWYWEPSVLTSICLIGIIVSIFDFAVPTVNSYLFSSVEWTAVEERQFESICIRLLNAREHITDVKDWLMTLKADKPKIYLVVMLGIFAVMAWFGSIIDNLLLTYLIVVGASLIPGLRKHGIIQQVTDAVANVRAGKPKTN